MLRESSILYAYMLRESSVPCAWREFSPMCSVALQVNKIKTPKQVDELIEIESDTGTWYRRCFVRIRTELHGVSSVCCMSQRGWRRNLDPCPGHAALGGERALTSQEGRGPLTGQGFHPEVETCSFLWPLAYTG